MDAEAVTVEFFSKLMTGSCLTSNLKTSTGKVMANSQKVIPQNTTYSPEDVPKILKALKMTSSIGPATSFVPNLDVTFLRNLADIYESFSEEYTENESSRIDVDTNWIQHGESSEDEDDDPVMSSKDDVFLISNKKMLKNLKDNNKAKSCVEAIKKFPVGSGTINTDDVVPSTSKDCGISKTSDDDVPSISKDCGVSKTSDDSTQTVITRDFATQTSPEPIEKLTRGQKLRKYCKHCCCCSKRENNNETNNL